MIEFDWSWTQAIVLSVLFIASLCRATFGFGDALLAVPILGLVIGLTETTPLVALCGVISTVLMLYQGFHEIAWSAVWRLVLASAFGISLGVYLLKQLPSSIALGTLGLAIFAFAIYSSLGLQLVELKSPNWGLVFGFVAGCFSGAWNTAGPPVVIYASLSRWPAETMRSSLQGVFAPMTIMLCINHFAAGLWTPKVLGSFVLFLPLLALATILGGRLASRMSADTFRRALNALLLVLGIGLVGKSLSSLL